MRKSPLSDNRIFIVFETIFGFLVSVTSSIRMAFLSIFRPKSIHPLTPNRFLELLHFILVSGPKKFWKKPTALGIGRSISTFLHFVFERDQKFQKNGKKGAFTLVEVLVAITLLSIILLFAFSSLGQIAFFKTRTADRIDLSRDLYSNVEQIISFIKDGGSIDYEEYWNRNAVGLALENGHFRDQTGFGNYGKDGVIGGVSFGSGSYYCRSGDGVNMGTGGCLNLAANNTFSASQSGVFQRYGQYNLQFLDLNSDRNSDGGVLGDADGDGNPLGDVDDEEIGQWPYAIGTGSTFPELYLFKKGDPSERIFLRYHLTQDPDAPPSSICDTVNSTGAEDNGCRGTIEILRLVARDFGISHNPGDPSFGLYDGKIDTWQCRSDFKCAGSESTPTGADTEWVPLFSDDINVRSLSFDPYPRRDFRKNWENLSIQSEDMIAPYVRLGISMGFSWKKRKMMSTNNPVVTVSTTINLTP